MNQNQPVDDDLQKAIDNITNTTNTDPVFSDPVAAPSSIPEGDTGELAEPVGPFPEPKVEMVVPAPEPLAPIDPIPIPDLNVPEPTPAPAPEPTPTPTPAPEPMPETPNPTTPTANLNQVKQAALRDLIPILDHLNINPTQKFDIYRDIFEDLNDYSVLEPAYHAASEIPDEKTRAESLLYLVESIDRM